MGEYAVSAVAGADLVSLGLGSCIGLVLLDRRAAVAGLAHVVLPAAVGTRPQRARQVRRHGGRRAGRGDGAARRAARRASRRCSWAAPACSRPPRRASTSGQRNDAAVRAELAKQRIPVAAADTGGSRGPHRAGRPRERARDLARRRRGRGGAVRGLARPRGHGAHASRRLARTMEVGGMSGQVLSPDAIAALVDAAKEGRLPEEPTADRTRQRRMRAVDFTRPDEVHRGAGAAHQARAGHVLPHGLDAPVRRAAHVAGARGHQRQPAHLVQRPRAGAAALDLVHGGDARPRRHAHAVQRGDEPDPERDRAAARRLGRPRCRASAG